MMTDIIEIHFNSLIENYEHKAELARAKKTFFLDAIEKGNLTREEAEDLALNYKVR